MAEGVVYADIRFPPPAPTAAPQRQLSPSAWRRVALALGLLCLLLLAALLGLGLHGAVGSCATQPRSMEQDLEHKMQQLGKLLAGQCQFCPAGWLWHSGSCYYLSAASRDWEKSKEDCCSRGARLATVSANATLAFLQHVSGRGTFHVGLRRAGAGGHWKWVDGSALSGLFPLRRGTAAHLSCGRVSGQGLASGPCAEPCRWVCEQGALTPQWGHGSALPTFLWGNTTYACAEPH